MKHNAIQPTKILSHMRNLSSVHCDISNHMIPLDFLKSYRWFGNNKKNPLKDFMRKCVHSCISRSIDKIHADDTSLEKMLGIHEELELEIGYGSTLSPESLNSVE